MKFLRGILKNKILFLGALLILAGLLFYSAATPKKVLVADIAANSVNTSTVNTATQSNSQRKTFYDDVNSLYWVFYYSGSAIAYSYSSNGSSWSAGGTISVSTNDFSVWYVSGTSTVYIVYDDDSSTGVVVKKGTLGSSSISWGSPYTVDSSVSDRNVAISRSSTGKLWVAFAGVWNTQAIASAAASQAADDPSSWNAPKTLDNEGTRALYHNFTFPGFNIVPMTTSGNVYFTYVFRDYYYHLTIYQNQYVYGNLWTDSSQTMGTKTSIAALPAMTSAYITIPSAVSMDTDIVQLIYENLSDSTHELDYVEYSSGAWGTPLSIEGSASNDDYPALSKNGTDLYAFYIRSNTIYYKKGVSPYGSGNWGGEATLVSSGTNLWSGSSYLDDNNYINLIFTSGTGNPYNVNFYGLAATGGAPTPTLSPTPTLTPTPTSPPAVQINGGVNIKGGTKL